MGQSDGVLLERWQCLRGIPMEITVYTKLQMSSDASIFQHFLQSDCMYDETQSPRRVFLFGSHKIFYCRGSPVHLSLLSFRSCFCSLITLLKTSLERPFQDFIILCFRNQQE